MDTSSLVFDCHLPPKIVFGWGLRREAGTIAASLGRKPLIIPGSRKLVQNGALDEITKKLQEEGVFPLAILESIHAEPTVDTIDCLWEECRKYPEADMVIAVGGGSALDAGKAMAALVNEPDRVSVKEYLEGVGSGRHLPPKKLRFLALPTTAGTGSEATINSVISSYQPPFKKSLRSPGMIADAILVDPELTASLPPDRTAWSGLDAITQCVESFISARSNSFSQMVAMDGFRSGFHGIRTAFQEGSSRIARERMSHCALLSGIALANSGLGLAHGVAAALGSYCNIPHGLACAMMLPAALRFNRECSVEAYARLADAVGVDPGFCADEKGDWLIDQIESLCVELAIPSKLSIAGVCPDMLGNLVAGSQGNSLRGNPRSVSDSALYELLESML